jgi:hypothetical protein
MSGPLSSEQIDAQILELQERSESLAEEELQHLIDLKAAQFLTRLATNLCTVCGGQVTKEVQVGRCVYGEPCGHRMRQGKARKL